MGRGSTASVVSLIALAATFVLIPLDDRPVTMQLPRGVAAIAGVQVAVPPRSIVGRYLVPGQPDAIARWLRDESPRDASAFIISADMVAYGGLIAARTPATPEFLAVSRLRELAAFRATRPNADFSLFGTVMRLAPTGVPAVGPATTFFAAGEPVELLTTYANLPDPPVNDDDRAKAARLRERLGPVLDAYLATRKRDRNIDLFELQLTAEGSFDRTIVGQDDAGPVGLHLRDLAALRAFAATWIPPRRAAIEPGADELAMILTGAELARAASIVPRVRVQYSRDGGGSINDPLEFAPIDNTVAEIIRASGAVRVDDRAQRADVDLFVRVPATNDTDELHFVDAIAADVATPSATVAVADLTFLAENDYAQQRALVETMIARHIAGTIDAFASWNTTANTVGTALPVAIAALVGKRTGSFSERAHAQFMLDRYADDYAFHDFVRPTINSELKAAGVEDHTLLLDGTASTTGSRNRALLWPRALDLLATIYPGFRDAGLTITLPWDRTFETELDVRLRPPARSLLRGGGR